MKKHLHAIIMIAAMIAACPQQSRGTDELPTLMVANGQNAVVTYQQVSRDSIVGSCVCWPKETVESYQGARITHLEINSANAGSNSAAIFISRNLNAEPDYRQIYTPAKNGWNKVELSTPYTLSTDTIYIGYEISGVRYLNYCNTFIQGEEWLKKGPSGWKRYGNPYSAGIKVWLEGDALPKNDVAVGHAVMPLYAKTGETVSCSMDIYNLGIDKISDIEVTYHVGDDHSQKETIAGLDMDNRTRKTIQLAGPTFSAEGNQQWQMEITAVNGTADKKGYDNRSRQSNMLAYNDYTKRKVLVELFSTERCTQCAAFDELLSQFMADKTDAVQLSHHSGFYTDKLTIDESIAYEWFYRPVNIHAPAVMFDRTSHFDNYPTVFQDTVPLISFDTPTLTALHQVQTTAPAFVSINLSASYDNSNRMVTIDVSGEQLLPVSGDSIRLNVFLTEDSIASDTQAGVSGTFIHRHAARKCLTTAWGQPIDVANGYNSHFSFVIPDEWQEKRMRVVAFVTNYNPNDKLDCKVLNANQCLLDGTDPTYINKVYDRSIIDMVTVYDMQGRVVVRLTGQTNTNDAIRILDSLPKGVYIVETENTNGTKRSKVSK